MKFLVLFAVSSFPTLISFAHRKYPFLFSVTNFVLIDQLKSTSAFWDIITTIDDRELLYNLSKFSYGKYHMGIMLCLYIENKHEYRKSDHI